MGEYYSYKFKEIEMGDMGSDLTRHVIPETLSSNDSEELIQKLERHAPGEHLQQAFIRNVGDLAARSGLFQRGTILAVLVEPKDPESSMIDVGDKVDTSD